MFTDVNSGEEKETFKDANTTRRGMFKFDHLIGNLETELKSKLKKAISLIEKQGPFLTAYSGGVDSSLLAYLAQAIFPGKSLAVTAASPTNAKVETKYATELATELNLNHIVIETDEMENPAFRKNDLSRCYHCKTELFTKLYDFAAEKGYTKIAYGLNKDDMRDFRPGVKAGVEMNILAPLRDAELTKQDIMSLAKALGLRNWNKPSQPCLSTRFPFGTEITRENLTRVEKAENCLREIGLKQFRLRSHDNIARIEAEIEDWSLLLEPANREKLIKSLNAHGYTYITMDLGGYSYGSMNKVIKDRNNGEADA